MNYSLIAVLMMGIWLAGDVGPGLAEESKSGVDPKVISLPKGPGSVEGLGESFEPQLNTGTAAYAVKIAVPPGVNKHQPEVALEYNGGYGNSPLGMGWSLNLDYIQRQTDKGLPGYTDSDIFMHKGGGELVPLAGGVYRLKIEGLFIKFMKTGDAWTAWRKNGNKLFFGSAESSRLMTPMGAFQWLLDREVDPNGNEIRYVYETHGGQVYLSEIRYSVMSDTVFQSIHFAYETRPDAFTDYRSRFKVLTDRRLSSIEVRSQGDLVRSYRLEYKADADVSLLAKVVQTGVDGESELPPVSFDYTAYLPETIQTIPMTNPPPMGISLSGNNTDLVDIDGDSLPDVVNTSSSDGIHYFYLNQGRGEWNPVTAIPENSPQYFLDSSGVMMSDMDGDGLSDLFVKTDDLFGYFRNQGNVTWEESDWTACAPNPGFNFDDPDVRLLDVNNDKRIDVIMDGGAEYYVWLNRKTNTWNTDMDFITLLPDGCHLNFSSPFTKMGDMNGDRIQDLVFVIDGHVSYFPGRGNGEFDAETIMTNPPAGFQDMEDRLALSDINNDGLADMVLVGSGTLEVWFNGGGDRFKSPVIFEGTPAYTEGTSAFRFADMNGDGFTDLLIIDPDAPSPWQYVDFNNGVHPNLLSGIQNGLGREIAITYRSSTEYYLEDRDSGNSWITKLPFPVQVVSRVTVMDKNSNASYVTDYAYRDGYYDGVEKEFRGFGEVDKITRGDASAPSLKTRYQFDVGKDEESRKGLVKSVAALKENGTVTPPSGLFDVQNNLFTTNDLLTGTNGERVRFSYISRTDAMIYENTATPKQTRQTIVQDNYGNTTEESNYGLVTGSDLAVGNDEVRTFTTYWLNTAAWMLDRPLEIRKTDLAGAFISHQKNAYDDKGNLIRQQAAVTDGAFIPTLENAFDLYGNIIRMTDGNGHWREIGYDPEFHTFPVSEHIGETGLSMTAEYNTGLGVITAFTDFNGNATAFGYDTFGRLTAIVKPGDSPAFPTQEFIYTLANPVSSVMTRSRETSNDPGTYDAVTYYDGLGRKLQTKSEGPSANWVVSEAVTFNGQGGVREKWLPYFSNSYACETPAAANPHITFAYDAKGRSIKETNPDASFKTTLYLPLQTTAHDEEDNGTGAHKATPHSFINDGLERLIEVWEKNGGDTYITRYEYDGQNNLIKIIDNEGNVKTMLFDGLGRKTHMNDPDKHEMTYLYDPAGNLVSTTDAKGQTVTYTYDPANRIVTENFGGVKVRYHYDADRSGEYPDLTNTLGKVTYVEDEAGREYYSYDARGNTVTKIREAGGYTFINKMAYDALDRMTALTYPDGFTVVYQYNAMNQLAAMPGFVSGIDYIATGQKAAFVYPNGVQSQYTYDSRQRMKNLKTEHTGTVLQDFSYSYDLVSNIMGISDGRPQKTTEDQTRTFAYDDLYRLTSAIAPAWTETYQYNSIGNMTFKSDVGVMNYGENGAGPHAVTSAQVPGITYAYDANGNISGKTPGFTYQFDHKDRMAGAKRLADNGAIAYAYDYKGNRVVKSVAAGGVTATTVYADKFTELRQDRLIKQVFAGDRLVARISAPFTPAVMETRVNPMTVDDFDKHPADGVISLAEIQALGTDPVKVEAPDVADALRIYLDNLETRPDVISFETMSKAFHELGGATPPATTHFYVPDHLGSASLVTDASGAVVEESVYYPYGADRARTGSFKSEYRFTGKELDDETGLHYFGARYYDSVVGRFVSVDPLINKDAKISTFQYVDNNPIKFTDPKGLSKKDNINKEQIIESITKKGIVLASKAPNWKIVPVAAKGLGGGTWMNRATKATFGNGYWRRVPNGAKIGPYFARASSFIDTAMDVKNGDYTGAAISGVKGAFEAAGKKGAGTVMGVLKGGYDEITDRGYSMNEVADAWANAGENISFGLENTDALIEAGIEGTTSVTAIAINAASCGFIDITGQQVQSTIENAVNKTFDFFGF